MFCYFSAGAGSSAAADPQDIGFTIQATFAIQLNGITLVEGSDTSTWPSTDTFVSTSGGASGTVTEGDEITAWAEGTGSAWVAAPVFDGMMDRDRCGLANTDLDDYLTIFGDDVCRFAAERAENFVYYQAKSRADLSASCA